VRYVNDVIGIHHPSHVFIYCSASDSPLDENLHMLVFQVFKFAVLGTVLSIARFSNVLSVD
jgi:hypothetical protein